MLLQDVSNYTPECKARHFGLWSIEPVWARSLVASIQAGMVPADTQAARDSQGRRLGYEMYGDGIAIVGLYDMMTKAGSKYGGTSTVEVRRALRTVRRAPDVKGVMLHVDSPGGTVDGTGDLADDLYALAREKPTHAHIDDLGASAAYYVASQASRVAVNRTGLVGSIGTMAVVYDSSAAAEQAGITVHVLASRPLKGAMTEGAPVTDEALARWQDLIDAADKDFITAVARGRRMTAAKIDSLADGSLWTAAQALDMRLVDTVQSMDTSLADLQREIAEREKQARRAARMRSARVSGAELG